MEGKGTFKKNNDSKQASNGRGEISPERAIVWKEKSPKYHYDSNYQGIQNQQLSIGGMVMVVYFLCRNRQLEHPHFLEVPISSPDGHLYLRDVIERLSVLRGRGMALMYSWSCKRSYKNGFVWHDLCKDDIVLPAHGNEYVLKGSELFEDSSPGHFNPVAANIKLENSNSIPESPTFRCQDNSSSPSCMKDQATMKSHEEFSPPPLSPNSPISPESCIEKTSSSNGSMNSTKDKVNRSGGLVNASTQTDERCDIVQRAQESSARKISCSSDDITSEPEINAGNENLASQGNNASEVSRNSISPPPSSSSASSSGTGTDTLGYHLMGTDSSKVSSFKILEEDEHDTSLCSKFKASNLLMHLISCGPISVKQRGFNLIPSYKPSFTSSRFVSPLFSPSYVLREPDSHGMHKNVGYVSLRPEDKGSFGRTLVEHIC